LIVDNYDVDSNRVEAEGRVVGWIDSAVKRLRGGSKASNDLIFSDKG
jgi:hypothetical protein